MGDAGAGAWPLHQSGLDEWEAAGVDRPTAQRWTASGIHHPQDRPAGIEHPVAYTYCVSAGVPVTPEWAALWGHADFRAAEAGYATGQTPQAVQSLCSAVNERGAPPRRGHSNVGLMGQDEVDALAGLAGLDWFDVAACVRGAGMSIADAAAFIRSGADLGPVRLLAGLSGG